MRKVSICALLAMVTLLTLGCGKPKLDTSSDEAFKKSAEEVKKSLPADKQDKFEASLLVVMMKSGMDAGGDEAKAKKALSGKSGEEIIAEADKIQQGKK